MQADEPKIWAELHEKRFRHHRKPRLAQYKNIVQIVCFIKNIYRQSMR